MRSLGIAATGMLAQQLNVEIISHNLANMNTVAFKRQRAEFQDLLYQNAEQMGVASSDAGTIVPTGVQIGLGVKAGSVYRVTEQGNLSQTGNPYDLAINGHGWFRVQMPDGGEAYTRAGNFSLSGEGELVTADGYTVDPGITIPQGAESVVISDVGQVQVRLAGDPEPQTVGQLELSVFYNEAGLEAVGDNYFLETAASGAPTLGVPGEEGFGTLRQGFIEAANVNPVAEITALIQAQRAYEMNARVITASDEMLATSSQLR
jgi:flagellar basal-body rod protein FlgG